MGIIDRIQAKLELMRLEKRYTRHRHRRSTFQTNAVYVDGEYIYQTPNVTGSSDYSSASNSSSGTSNTNAAVGMNAGSSGFMSSTTNHDASVFDAHLPPRHFAPDAHSPAPISPASMSSQDSSLAGRDQRSKRNSSMQMPAFGGSYAQTSSSSSAASSPTTKTSSAPPSAW
ncbi:hypothetical protein BROUX41_003171 [Berkeleyomyces rouxiae]|uniref:uncharacterized protein n=1 Tax=Berkeleyomyces rouxiae TaxID=2035830 RepID=UPI003B7EB6D8